MLDPVLNPYEALIAEYDADKIIKKTFYKKPQRYEQPENASVIFAPTSVKPKMQQGAWIDANNLKAIARYFNYAKPSKRIGVTGSYGKGSVITYLAQFLDVPWVINGTSGGYSNFCGAKFSNSMREMRMNIDHPVTLHALMARMHQIETLKKKPYYYITEAFYDKLYKGLYDEIGFTASAYTNITYSHVETLADGMKQYIACKLKLLELTDGPKVVNSDCMFIKDKISAFKDVITFGRSPKAALRFDEHFLYFDSVKFPREQLPIHLNLFVHNLLCAIGLAMAEGVSTDLIVNQLPILRNQTARLEQVPHPDFDIIVDVCWCPVTLLSLMQYLRGHCKGRLICVFGSYTHIAPWRKNLECEYLKYADVGIYCPRDRSFCREVTVPPELELFKNRHDAIQFAFASAKKGDTVLLCGNAKDLGVVNKLLF